MIKEHYFMRAMLLYYNLLNLCIVCCNIQT